MANTVISKQARRAAREAATAAQEELVRRTKANVEDLAAFFSARERAEAVDGWLAQRQQVLREDAARRRHEQRVMCGQALASMRDRGESLREVARMAGVAEKQARELIREAEAAAENAPAQARAQAVATAAQPPGDDDGQAPGIAAGTPAGGAGQAMVNGRADQPAPPRQAAAPAG